MRSPFPTPGRNTIIENIWQSITSFARTAIQGQQRPRSQMVWSGTSEDIFTRRYDLEIREPIIRRKYDTDCLVEMVEHCPEISTAIEVRNNSIWGSQDGDDIGWDIASTLNDQSPIEPEIYDILARLRDEVIGGITLKQASERFLSWGDSFCSIGVNKAKQQIDRVLFLPTFEMFRIEDVQGQLRGFQQRKTLVENEDTDNTILFHPLFCIHWRYRRKFLYGRSLFAESICDWQALKDVLDDLRNASRAIGINPNVHILPCEYDETDAEEYKRAYEQRKRQGAVTDFYFMNGGDIKKLSTTNPDFKGLLELANFYRLRIAMKSQVPLYLLGIPWDGGKDIASQPAMAFARSINADRQILTEGIKHLCNLELALKGIPKERWQYRIIYPKIIINPWDQAAMTDETNSAGIEDLDIQKINSGRDYLTRVDEGAIYKQLAEVLG